MVTSRRRLTGVLASAAILLSACGSSGNSTPAESEGPGSSAPASASQAPTNDFSFALVTPNPRGDRSFIDASAAGAERAISELGVEGSIIEARGVPEQEAAIRGAISQDHDLVLALAPEPDIISKLAAEFPDQKFAVPSDLFLEDLPDNLAAFQINVHEVSYLVGVVAGMMTETKVVGAVVGGDSPGLNQFYWAYKQGVLAACPDCAVLVSYLGFDFANPTLGKETALGLFEQDADILFQVAGRSGEGVISAAQETGNFAIGVDANQDEVAPGTVIVSAMKKVDQSTFLLVKNAMEGNYSSGFSVIGMEDGATALSWDEGSTTFADEGPDAMTAKLADVQAAVEEARDQVLDGSIDVCNALEPTDACDGLAE
ncbi:MAG: BMP family ABC transporter substrate-binding protein [Candidatus Limnocylindria bacterium]